MQGKHAIALRRRVAAQRIIHSVFKRTRFAKAMFESLEPRYFFCAAHQSDLAATGETCFVKTADASITQPLAQHIHAFLSLAIDGKPIPIPADIGIRDDGSANAIHTHDATGKIHVEAFDTRTRTLGEFFENWGVTFPQSSTVLASVDGLSVADPRTIPLTDGARIELRIASPTTQGAMLPSASALVDAYAFQAVWDSLASGSALTDFATPLSSDSLVSEPHAPGINRLRIRFSDPVDPLTLTSNTFKFWGTQQSTGTLLDLSAISASTSLSGDALSLTVNFSQALPDRARYRFELQGLKSNLGKPLEFTSTWREARALLADANSDGKVDSLDFTAFASGYGDDSGNPSLPYGRQSDVNLDGKLNTLDFNPLAHAFGHNASGLSVVCGDVPTRGKVSVFDNAPIDWNTNQYKPTVDVCVDNLGNYDVNGNVIGSNAGALNGKWGNTTIVSFDEQSGVPAPFDSLPHVNEISSPTNDFRVDYTGGTQSDPRTGILQSAQGHFYHWIDDYRKRFLNDSFIDSLNLPAQLAQNLKNLQYRPDLISSPSPTLLKPGFEVFETQSAGGLTYNPITNTYRGDRTRTRANVLNYASLPPLSMSFDGALVVADYVGLATIWMAGFNQLSLWESYNMEALSDGMSHWTAYRYTGNPEVYSYANYVVRAWAPYNCGGNSNVPCNKGYLVRNVMMNDPTVTNGVLAFPFSANPTGGVPLGRGPTGSEWAGLYFAGVLYDIANEVGLGNEKTDRLAWKSISLITNPTNFNVYDFRNAIMQAARSLWPKPGNPAQSIYEDDLVQVLASRGLSASSSVDFKTYLPTAIGTFPATLEFSSANGFGSSHSEGQASAPGDYTTFVNSYNDPGAGTYTAYQFYKHSKYGPCDKLALTSGGPAGSGGGSFWINPSSPFNWSYNNDGAFYTELADRDLGNKIVLLPGTKVRWLRSRQRCANDAAGQYSEDVRPFGFRVIKAIPNGFSFQATDITPASLFAPRQKTYSVSVVDPSLTTLGPASYAWIITAHDGTQTALSGQTVQFSVATDEPFTIKITRTRGATVDSIEMRERGSDFARNGGNAFVVNLVPPAGPVASLSLPATRPIFNPMTPDNDWLSEVLG